MITRFRLWLLRRKRMRLLKSAIAMARLQLADLESRPASSKLVVSRAYLANAIERAEESLAAIREHA